MNASVQALSQIRKLFRDNPQEGDRALDLFIKVRNDPASEVYAPYASGKSNYKELTDFFGMDRFDDDFFVKGSSLNQYHRYGASGAPLVPTKKSKPKEIAAYQFYRVQKADETTRQLEDQWRALQKELADKVNILGMDDDAIVQSIDWGKYGALKEYEANVKIRNVPMLTRPVSFSEDSVYGVLAAVRKGGKVGQTGRDYLPELTDYYDSKAIQKNIQPNVNKKGLPGYQRPAGASGSTPTPADNQTPTTQPPAAASTPEYQAGNPDSYVWKTEELDAIDVQKRQERQDKIDFSNLQYKMFTGQELTDDERKHWTELYPAQGHGKQGASIPAGLKLSSSGGGSAFTIEQQNDAWVEKYKGIMQAEYGGSMDSHMLSIEQLAEMRNSANTLGITVEQYLSSVVGKRPVWLDDLDYKQKRKDNPELITRLRPIEEVLPDYRAGNLYDLSEAEQEMIWMYDKKHPGLLGGLKQVRAGDISIPVDERKSLGKTAYAALQAADSSEFTPEESNAVILSIGQDMDDSFGKYASLQEYYDKNPERKSELQAFVDEENARAEESAAVKAAKDAENAKQAQQYAMSALTAYSKGDALDENQKQFIEELKTLPVTDADKDDTYKQLYTDAEGIISSSSPSWGSPYGGIAESLYSGNQLAYYWAAQNSPADPTYGFELKHMAKDILDTDVKLAKAAGMKLTQYYQMFPEMKKTPAEIANMARNAYDEKWDDRGGIFEFLFGIEPNTMTGKGVGAGTALGKGAESGGLQFLQENLGFVRNYITETDEATVQAWNRRHYGGPMGRARAKKDFTAAIEKITDPEHKKYWQDYMEDVKDIYDLPFNFSDESVLNGLYENKKALKQIESFMLSNGTPAEYAAFMVTSSLVDNTLSMTAAAVTTAVTGNPVIGTAAGFAPAAAYSGSEAGRAAGLPRLQRNVIGLGTAAITVFTENAMRIQYNNASAFMRGSARQLEALAVQNGTKLVNRIGMKVAFGTATIGARLLENAAEEMTQEGFENILTDVWLNITGAQDKELGTIIDDAARASIMAAILSPVLSGELYLLTSKGKVLITDNIRKWAREWMDGKITETMQNPDALAKAIHAEAAAQTIDALANGGLKDVNASAVEKTRDDLKKAEANVAKAANTYNAARTRYADEMHKCSVSFTAMSDEKHDLFMQTLLNAKNAYQSAIKAVSDLRIKLKQDQGMFNRLLSGIIANARAEGKENAQTSILSEAAARRMDAGTQKADGIKQAAAQTGQPSPENVSNEGGPIAQGSDSGIMIENGQGEVGVRDTGNADRLTSVDAGKADIYNANGNPELRSLRRPIFDSMLNDGFEIDGNKFRLNKHAYNTLFKSQRKDIMPADISEALKTKPISGNPGSLKYVNPVTGTKIFVNPETNEIVGVWPAGFRN